MIELRNAAKKLGQTQALYPCTLTLPTGQLILLAGSDGAGKTTLIKLLTGLLIPDQGDVRIDGQPPQAKRLQLGYCAQNFSWYGTLTVEENVLLSAQLYGLPPQTAETQCRDILSFVGLYPFRHRLGSKLSGGMKKKAALAAAMVHQPDYLFLDEPSTGIDPVSRQELWDLFKRLQAQGKTLVITSPYFTEAVYCQTILLFHQGHLLVHDTLDHLRAAAPHGEFDLEQLFFTLTEEG